MIKSMTGFGRGVSFNETRKITVEMKSVNHRYLDLNLKLPRKCNPYEADVRNFLKSKISRGKVDVYVTLEETADSNYRITYNSNMAAMYLEHLKCMSEEFQLKNDITATSLSHYPDVLVTEEIDAEETDIPILLMDALGQAMDQFLFNRSTEGQHLCNDLLDKMTEMEGYVQILKDRSPEIIEEYKTRLTEKIADLLGDHQVDEGRIAAEVTIYADKVCIDEEIVRLSSHVRETKEALLSGGEVGRKLDFIAQEMNREANTILSKCNDLETSGIAIELKTEIEKVREQIQNIE